MNYLINDGELKYIKDKISGEQFLIEKVENVEWLPSSGQDFTLYVLENGICHYSSNFVFRQVEPDIQVIEEQVIAEEKVEETVKVSTKK